MKSDNNKMSFSPQLRWIDMLCLTVVAVIICILFHSILNVLSIKLSSILSSWPKIIQYLIVCFISGLLWFILIRLGGFRPYDLRSPSIYRFPPIWLFGILGTIAYTWIISFNKDNAFDYSLNDLKTDAIYFSSIPVGFICVSFLNRFLGTGKQKYLMSKDAVYSPQESFDSIINDPERFFAWIEKETPIKSPHQDLFGLSIIARRMSRILINENLKTIGVVGAYGCGKTSLLNIVEYYLQNRDAVIKSDNPDKNEQIFIGDILVCRVDGWGRSKGSVAQQILSIVVKRLCFNVDVLSVITVPSNYLKAIQGVKSIWMTIFTIIFSCDHDPIAQLQKLDSILQANKFRLIIFLEDLDRNTCDEIIRDELPALLDRLRYLTNVSFVLAIGKEHQYSDILIKICDHQESIV